MEWLWLALASLLGIIWAFIKGRSEGREQERGKQSKQVLERVDDAQKSKRDSDRLSDDEAIERMRERARK